MEFNDGIDRIKHQLSVTDKYLCCYLLSDDNGSIDTNLFNAWNKHCWLFPNINDDCLLKLFWVLKLMNCYHFHLTYECRLQYRVEKKHLDKLLVVYGYQYLMDSELIELIRKHLGVHKAELNVKEFIRLATSRRNLSFFKALKEKILEYCNDDVRELLKNICIDNLQFDNDIDSATVNLRREEQSCNSSSADLSQNRRQRKGITEQYNVKKKSKNYCFVFSDGTRDGNDYDLEKIEKCFKEVFNYKIKEIEMESAEYVYRRLEELQQYGEDSNLFVFIFMCHGKEGCLKMQSDEWISIHRILNYFHDPKATYFQKKPKLVLFQSCRGNLSNEITDEVNQTNIPRPLSILEYPDFFIIYACLPYHGAVRITDMGSLFIGKFLQLIKDNYESHSIRKLFLKYNENLPTYENRDFKQYLTMLSIPKKDLYLIKTKAF